MKRMFISSILLLVLFAFIKPANFYGDLFESLPLFKNYKAGRVSSYDRDGGNADFLKETTGTVTLAEIEGPGAITHIWVTINSPEEFHLRKIIIRIYWDGEEYPSVEAPIGDFFGLGHGKYYLYHSMPISIGSDKGMNCFWFMPFKESAKITITNEGRMPIRSFYYYIDYRQYDEDDIAVNEILDSMGMFHAQYSQQSPPEKKDGFQILYAEGKGHYVGCNMSIELNSNGWWGEGDDKFYIDGEEAPSIQGTGSEDYFCGAWCYADDFYSLYFGCPLHGKSEKGGLWNVYRYHIENPITFNNSIKLIIEAIHSNAPEDLPDNYSCVAYWYQTEPHLEFPEMPVVADRIPKINKSPMKIEGALEAENLSIARRSAKDEVLIQNMTAFQGLWSNDKQIWFPANNVGDFFELKFNIHDSDQYLVHGYFTKSHDYGIMNVYIDNSLLNITPIDLYAREAQTADPLKLGKIKLKKGMHIIKFVSVGRNMASSSYMIGVDCLKFEKIAESKSDTIIIDNRDKAMGFYTEGKWNNGVGGQDYDGDVDWAWKGRGECRAYWRPKINNPGTYSVYIWYGADPANDHATDARYTVNHAKGEEVFFIDLTKNFGDWTYLGDFEFDKGLTGFVMTDNKADGNVLADAVKFMYKPKKKKFLFWEK